MSGGRPQVPLDPADTPLAHFATQLRELRTAAGSPTYRTLAQRSGAPAGSLARAAGGRSVPGVSLVRAYVLACGGDELLWVARWRAMVHAEQSARRRPGARSVQEG